MIPSGSGSSNSHEDNNHTEDDNDSHGNNTSKEAAALARGAARTAAASSSSAAGRSTAIATRGVMAGRLPISSSAAATTTTTASSKAIGSSAASTTTRVIGRKAQQLKVPGGGVAASRAKVVPRGGPPRSTSTPLSSSRIPKARANSIAKVSDRASKGLDVLHAGLDVSSESHSQNNTITIKKSISRVTQQAVAFGKVFITNTILGMAVFSTYEGMIEHLASSSNMETSHETTNVIVLQQINPPVAEECNIDVMDQATLPQHFFAGAMGGAAHAALSLAFDMKFSSRPGDARSSNSKGTTAIIHPLLKLQTLSSNRIHLQVPTLHFTTSSIIHHSLAHSTLFGSYQLTKRLLSSQIHNYNSEDGGNNSLGYESNDTIRVATIAVAGGVAGQFQHVISHFSEQWLLDNSTTSTSLLQRVRLSSWPTWRPTVMAFPPSAIGFLAFEFGKLLNTSDGAAI